MHKTLIAFTSLLSGDGGIWRRTRSRTLCGRTRYISGLNRATHRCRTRPYLNQVSRWMVIDEVLHNNKLRRQPLEQKHSEERELWCRPVDCITSPGRCADFHPMTYYTVLENKNEISCCSIERLGKRNFKAFVWQINSSSRHYDSKYKIIYV